MVDGVPMSGLVAAVPEPHAVIVAFHGGATSAAYFDCPGHPRLSLLRTAAAQNYTAIALDRPGYGASALYADDMGVADRRVALARGAVDKILGDGARGAGVFVLGHSAGCELALRTSVSSPVIGVALAGTGLHYSPYARSIISQATITSRPAGLRELLWEPTELYPPEVLTGALSAPGVAYEGEVTANWPRRDFAEVAAQVRVPVEFTVADHERVWESSSDSAADVAALFTAAPRVEVSEMRDSGHNLSVGLTAATYHQRVLSFAHECVRANEVEAS
jgi:pimeloyl-ACP methyl ester carboxylesterase